jgi:hypothetical protein
VPAGSLVLLAFLLAPVSLLLLDKPSPLLQVSLLLLVSPLLLVALLLMSILLLATASALTITCDLAFEGALMLLLSFQMSMVLLLLASLWYLHFLSFLSLLVSPDIAVALVLVLPLSLFWCCHCPLILLSCTALFQQLLYV